MTVRVSRRCLRITALAGVVSALVFGWVLPLPEVLRALGWILCFAVAVTAALMSRDTVFGDEPERGSEVASGRTDAKQPELAGSLEQ